MIKFSNIINILLSEQNEREPRIKYSLWKNRYERLAAIMKNPELIEENDVNLFYRRWDLLDSPYRPTVPNVPINSFNPAYEILWYYPELIDKFITPHIKMSGKEILYLLRKHPHLAPKFDLLYKLDQVDKISLYNENPKLVDIVNPSMYKNNSGIMSVVLSQYPEAVDKFNIEHLTPDDMKIILIKQPKLINIFKKIKNDAIYKLEHREVEILAIHPQLLKKFDYHNFSRSEIIFLLSRQPELVEDLDLSDYPLTTEDIAELIGKQPKLIYSFNVSNLNGIDISRIYTKHPQLIDKLPLDNMTGIEIEVLLVHHPEAIDHLKPYLSKLTPDHIYYILQYQPQLAKYFDLSRINKITSGSFKELLRLQPTLIPILIDVVKMPKKDIEELIDLFTNYRSTKDFRYLIPYLQKKLESME